MIDTIVAGKYRVLSLLGSGGMANVYKAYDEQLGRFVSLKVLREEHREDPEFIRRFRREAQAVFSLEHPNIVRSYDVGEDGDIVYIALEYISGCSLKEYIRDNGALTYKRAAHIMVQVLSALACAHAAGIIHRDVKPQNVLLTQNGVAKLTDFGIARDAAATTRTFAGTNVIGSVHYFSPEQAKGEVVDIESDIYSCGIMLYEMLIGQVPFAGDNSVTIALKHLQEEITPPVEMNGRIPRALSDITVKAVSKDTTERYHSADEMRLDIERALKEPHGRFASAKPREHKGLRRGVIGNLLLALVILGGLGTAVFFGTEAIRESGAEVNESYIVPKILGKKIEEATQIANLRGFELEIEEYAISEDYDEGCIMAQYPVSGVNGKSGDKITVTVSTGSQNVVVPDLTGMTLQQALNALADAELSKGELIYIASDKPDGEVINQDPVVDTVVYRDDSVDIWLSGTVDNSFNMPATVNLPLQGAISSLKQSGFNQIRVSFVTHEDAEPDAVLKQTPTAGMSATRDMLVELTVARENLGLFSADIAFNVTVEDKEQEVVVTAMYDETTEYVLFRENMPVGKEQTLSFTGYMRTGAEYTCRLYIGGKEARSNVFAFTYKR